MELVVEQWNCGKFTPAGTAAAARQLAGGGGGNKFLCIFGTRPLRRRGVGSRGGNFEFLGALRRPVVAAAHEPARTWRGGGAGSLLQADVRDGGGRARGGQEDKYE